MRTIFLILLLPSISLATTVNGPKWTYPESPKLDDEMNNIYTTIRTVDSNSEVLNTQTLAQIKAYTPSRTGSLVYCSNCSTDAVCVSSGSTRGAYVELGSRATACQ